MMKSVVQMPNDISGISFSQKKLVKVISGGQTGVDQAGLFAAISCGLETGGQAPENYLTSAGNFPMLELFGLTADGNYYERTGANVKNSDGTIIIAEDLTSAGSSTTRRFCSRLNKPCLEIELPNLAFTTAHVIEICEFITTKEISILNVAGNRERYKNNSVFYCAKKLLTEVFTTLKQL